MEGIKEDLQLKVQQLPHSPGVYLFKDARGNVIYVGKAVDLRQRVRSYFQKPPYTSPRLGILIKNLADLSYILTDSEEEAFILESNLIKEYSPRYNVQFKDDKHYPYLRFTLEEPFPRMEVARKIEDKKSRYFGPYSNSTALRQTMSLIKKLFPLRSCRQSLEEGEKRGRPCLNYQMNRCLAPCSGEVTTREYNAVVEQVLLFLEGQQADLLKKIEEEMNSSAEALEFEKAARLRDQYHSLKKVMEKQKVVTTDLKDRDIIALALEEDGMVAISLFRVRAGKLLGAENFTPSRVEEAEEREIMKEFIRHYYGGAFTVPGELLLSHLPAEEELFKQWLKKKKGGKSVYMKVPQRGEKKALLQMAKKNAHAFLEQERTNEKGRARPLKELAEVLGLSALPERIEGYDISHFSGHETVGSMVVFWQGEPYKEGYRRFKIRAARKADDYAALTEILRRRFSNETLPRPSLLLIDGGRGQLSTAIEVLKEKGLEDIPLASLAKEEEHIFVPGQKAPLMLPENHPALKLLQQVRDEAHRFAVKFSKNLNLKRSLSSLLQSVPGIGPVRRKTLLKHFNGMEELYEASLEELRSVPGMNTSAAQQLYEKLHGEDY